MELQIFNILLVSDGHRQTDPVFQELKSFGHQVKLISSGFQALAELEKSNNHFQIIFFLGDYLEEMSSLEAISHIKVIQTSQNFYIIHLINNKKDSFQSIGSGSNAVLTNENLSKMQETLKKIANNFFLEK